MAKIEHPLKTKDGLTSGSGSLYRSYETDKIVDSKLNEIDKLIYEPSKLKNGLFTVDFAKEKEKEVVLNVLPGSVRSDKEYATQIIWTLENGP
ncbi:hypothetical protein DOK67_0002530 [Enterococcus sp. DIV0212c]|uniref:hypothetical protein n=1 Tax=Enterococcus sp. DIV0212c TaxID=2230867 RepID=UPI001A9C0641|nr:hypothetical protein [Enterococcus sp. DIV0212c]MBO1353540.1 hypothetical protein [Enterococcus sp. DIV0212c]